MTILGLPDGIFSNQNPNVGKYCRVLPWKMLVFLWPLDPFYGHLVYFMATCWSFGIFFHFGMLYQVKSGNPDPPIIGPDVPLFKIFRVRIPPGYKVFRFLGKHSSAVVCKMTYIISIVCVLKGEIKALATKLFFFF
jgi:hypothetical protein